MSQVNSFNFKIFIFSIILFFLSPGLNCFLPFIPNQEVLSQISNDTIPEVHFAVFRLDYLTYKIKGVCEFSQPYRKSSPDSGYKTIGDYYYYIKLSSLGSITIKSSLTGSTIFKADIFFWGNGSLVFPPITQFINTNLSKTKTPEPQKKEILSVTSENTIENSNIVWSIVRQTQEINRIATYNNYEILIFDQIYMVYTYYLGSAEWIVIANSYPRIPEYANQLPNSFNLYQNYPNPFNATTTIRYAIMNKERVNLAVYNLLGQKIKILIDEEHIPGVYNILWDGKNDHGLMVTSGIYFYTLTTLHFKHTGKMVLLK